MVAIVSVETVLLVLLVILVAGLLRSHAEILRRLGPGSADTGNGSGIPAPVVNRSEAGTAAPAITGTTLEGDQVRLDLAGGTGPPTLLAFLSSGCSTCAGFWESLGERRLPEGVESLIITHGAEREQPGRLRSLAAGEVPVVMSSEAWSDYSVPGSPYFILVDGTIRGEGAAPTWERLASLVTDAIEDQRENERHSQPRPDPAVSQTQPSRAGLIEERLAAAGIGPEHPSLRPADE